METLIFLLPMFIGLNLLSWLILFALLVSGTGFYFGNYGIQLESSVEACKIGKKLLKFSVIPLFIVLLTLPLANIKQSYVNLVAYRAINSDSADKVIRNANLLLDTLGAKLEGLGE